MSFDNIIHGTLGLQFEETTVQHHFLGVQMVFQDGPVGAGKEMG